MSTRWMVVQYVGNTLRLPMVNESDMGKPFGSSVLEREVRCIVVNPFSDSPQVFVPEVDNAKLRKLCADMLSEDMDQHWPEFTRRARELRVDVDA